MQEKDADAEKDAITVKTDGADLFSANTCRTCHWQLSPHTKHQKRKESYRLLSFLVLQILFYNP